MPAGQYLIYPASDQFWAVQFEDRFLARFPEKAQAIRAAVTLASATAKPNAGTRVMCEGPNGERYCIWGNERDSYVSAA